MSGMLQYRVRFERSKGKAAESAALQLWPIATIG